MTVTAITMVKDESDIVEATVTNMARQVDRVIVADNRSTDGTSEILARLAADLGNVTVVDDPKPAYMQSHKMTALAHRAHRETGCEWVVPFDADEIWYSNAGRLGDQLEDIGLGMMVVNAELVDHVASGKDPVDGDPVGRIQWRRDTPLPLPKIACRYRPDLVIYQGNHGCAYSGIIPASVNLLVVRHFPYRSPEQFVRKVRNGAAAYRAAGDRLPTSAGAHWRQWGDILDGHGEEACIEIFRTWFWRDYPDRRLVIGAEVQAPLIRDPAPVRR